MNSLSPSLNTIASTPHRSICPSPKRCRTHLRLPHVLSFLNTSGTVSEVAGDDDVMLAFVKERELDGDFVTKVCDRIWLRGVKLEGSEADGFSQVTSSSAMPPPPPSEDSFEENASGFLKLTSTNEWLKGSVTAPANKKLTVKEIKDNSDRRKRLNLLKYEALQRELLLMTAGIGAACCGYCLFTLSIEAAVSYLTGVLFSCLYLILLCQHADNLSKEKVPQIFMQKKSKKIGIRSQDLQDVFEKSVRGSGIALSSPRLVIPAAIYGLWELSQHFTHELFDFQLVPAMVGLFAYKAAALVQVYRDNDDLPFIFPESEEGSQE